LVEILPASLLLSFACPLLCANTSFPACGYLKAAFPLNITLLFETPSFNSSGES
jgi:hypothetical protein